MKIKPLRRVLLTTIGVVIGVAPVTLIFAFDTGVEPVLNPLKI